MNTPSSSKKNLIERLILKDYQIRSGPKYNLALGFIIRAMQVVLIVFIYIIFIFIYSFAQEIDGFYGLAFALAVVLPLVYLFKLLEPWAIKLRLFSRTLTTSRAHHILRRRPKDYVLYLRSFQDDDNLIDDASFEERLCWALRWLGPVIAIGQPSETYIPRGAARFYFHGNEWKEIALDLMENARLVAIRMGQTEGLWWEVEQIFNQEKSIPTLFIFSDEEDTRIKERFVEILQNHNPIHSIDPKENFDFVFYESGTHTQLMTRDDKKYHLAEQKFWSIEESLRNVYERFDIILPTLLSFRDRVVNIFRIAGLILLADQISKHLATSLFDFGQNPLVVSNFLNFVLVWNRGVSFGMLASQSILPILMLNGMAIAITILLFVWCCRTPPYKRLIFDLRRIGMCCVIGGSLGNIVDRFRFGAVIDFIDLHYSGYHWPAFNIADLAIYVGAILMMFSLSSRRI